jgi:hypothetical protein
MINPNFILSQLSGFSGSRVTIKRNQDVYDIIGAMLEAHKIHAAEYDKIASYFWAGSDEQTARNLFNFLKKNVRYKIETDQEQRVMSPAAILTLKANDCKNYALFINGVLDALKRQGKIKGRILYRFASYKLLDEAPHHVFSVLQIGNDEYWIDPVLKIFNERKIYFHKIDREPMALYSVSGIGQTKKEARKEKRAERKEARQEKKAAKNAPPVPSAKPKNKKKIVLQISLSPARTAFLLLVGMNFAGLATKLKKALDNKANETKNFWFNLGGNPNKFVKMIEQGAKKRRILGIGEPATITAGATAAVAAPILVKVAEFLKKLGIEPEEIAEAGKKLLANKVREVVNKEVQRSEERASLQQLRADEIVEQADGAPGGSGKNLILPIAIGAGVLFLLTRKK